MIKKVTLSFAHGKGNMDHNARRKNGNLRTWGKRNRRVWNETIVERNVDEVLEQMFGDELRTYNEKQIAKGHPERTKTMSEWVSGQRRGRVAYTEYVVQIGNRLTGCAYDYVIKDGKMIAEDGSVIMPWQTKKVPKAVKRDGKIFPSAEQSELKTVYRAMLQRFIKVNPHMIIVGAYIHCDEQGGVHMHIDAICVSKTKNGIGLGLGVTGCLEQTLKDRGIKHGKSRKDNAQRTWTRLMREELMRVAREHGYEIIDGRCHGRKHVDTDTYIEQENVRNEYLDKVHNDLQLKEKSLQERERALNVRLSDLDARAAQIKRAECDLDARELGFQKKLKDLERRERRVNTLKKVADTTMEAAKRIRQDADRSWNEANRAIIECDTWKERYRQKENELAVANKHLADRDDVIKHVKAAHPEWFKNIEIGRSNGNGNWHGNEL